MNWIFQNPKAHPNATLLYVIASLYLGLTAVVAIYLLPKLPLFLQFLLIFSGLFAFCYAFFLNLETLLATLNKAQMDLVVAQEVRQSALLAEKAKRTEALANADSSIKFLFRFMDEQAADAQSLTQQLLDRVKSRPVQGFLINLGWALVGTICGIVASRFTH